VATHLPKTSWKRESPFRLGDHEVFPASCEVRTRRGVERLRPLLMDILLRLAAEPGVVVRRETLLQDVWPRRMVNDEVLSRAIAELRTALGDDARVARYIETMPKLGYRLVATIAPLAVEVPGGTAAAPPPANPARRSPRRWAAAGVLAAFAAAIALAIAWFALPGKPAPAALERRLTLARPLTSDPGMELAPRLSPDGTRVAFALVEGDESRIVVQSLDGASRQLVGGATGHTRLNPVFFPDGTRIAYWKASEQDCAIVEHALATGLERVLLDCSLSPRGRFDLSADGRWLVFVGNSRRQYPFTLWLLELGRGAPIALTSSEPGAGDDVAPRFSPDGSRVVFFRGNESHRAPWIVERANPASARRLAPVEGLSYGAAWLGADGPLLVAADWFGFRALNLLDLRAGEARIAGARGARYPDVGPHGEIVYENAAYSANLWPVDPQGGAAKEPAWPSTRYTLEPEFSPDGARVAFASNRDGTDALYVASWGGPARLVAFGEGLRYAGPHWSADGKALYAVRTQSAAGNAASSEGVRIPLDGAPVQVLPLGSAVKDVREGGDGMLYWGEAAGHAMRLMRAPLADPSRWERLALPLVSHYQLAGGRLAFVQPQLERLTLCRLDTLACTPSKLEIAPTGHYHWTLTPDAIYARVPGGDTTRLARFDVATQARTRTWDISPGGAGASIAVSADGSKMLVVKEDPPAIDLMIAR